MRGNQVTQKKARRAPTMPTDAHRLLAVPLAIAALLALFASPALAAQTHPLGTTFGSFTIPSSVAVDEASGNVFVADASPFAAADAGVEIFGPEGGTPSGVAASEVEASPSNERLYVAVDNSSTSPSKGALYVTDPLNHVVRKLVLNPLSEEYEPKGTLSPSPAFVEPLGVGIDVKGNVYVGGYNLSTIVKFSPTGVELDRIAVPSPPASLVFDSAGNLFVQGAFGGGVWKLDANGSGEIEADASSTQIRPAGATGLAIDRGTDTLYAAVGKRVAQYDAACVPVNGECQPELEFGFGALGSTRALAANSASGDIYVADRGRHNVALFGRPIVTVPDTVTKPPTDVKLTSATLHGTVSAAGGPDAVCAFQYTTKADFEAEEFEGASTAPCAPGGPFIGTGEEAVSAAVSGLDPGAAYFFRLLASNENGPNPGETLSLSTVGLPKIDAAFIADVSLDGATVEGLVNPNGGPNAAVETTYTVEYVSDADFKASGYADAVKVPAAGKAIGSGTADVKVAQRLSGLAVGSAYHFRIVAENEAGEEKGPDMTFATYAEVSAGLSDGRVYEQVTPVDKNGATPSGGESEIQAATDGDGIVYVSGGGIPGAEGAQQFPSYLASRGSDWSTQGLLPPASSGSSGVVNGWSEDLARAYVAQAGVRGDPMTFLQRDSATRSLRPIATEGKNAETFNYVDAAADGSVVAFESAVRLPAGGTTAKGASNTYVWDRDSGEPFLAGVLNNGQVPAKGTLAGSNQSFELEKGGQNQYLDKHYTQAEHVLSSDGSRLFFRDPLSGQLYVRVNPTQPQSPLDGQKECTEAAMACTVQISASQRAVPDPKGQKPAAFMTATPDGSQAFFTGAAKLTDEATTGPADEGTDLYRYDVNSGELTDLTPDTDDPAGAEVQGVAGVSDDGAYVYFAANGVLADGATGGDCKGFTWQTAGKGECNLYLWHDGVTIFIARLQMSVEYSDSANLTSTGSGAGQKSARVTSDGQTLLFRSRLQLTDYDNEETPEFYRYRAAAGDLGCVSCNPTGAAPTAIPALQSIHKLAGSVFFAGTLTRNLSADGTRVFFDTAEKLVANDTNGDDGCPSHNEISGLLEDPRCRDVYEWEAKGSGTCTSAAQNGGCLYLLSTGTSTEPAYFADASASGNDAFIFTDQRLVGQDKDQITDIYDARVGGGIASQNPPLQPEPCAAETSCRGAVITPPASQSPGTSTFSGPGNPKPSPHKKAHKKKKSQKKQHKKRHASRKHG